MKYFLLLTLIFSTVSAKPKEASKWQTLMKLIDQEISTINRARKKTSSLKYRLLELQSEKIKLWKQKENENFVKMGLAGKKISRKRAFKKTLELYEQARRQGLDILKRHPRSPYKPAIYYTLALNSRDYSYDEKEFTYLRSALALSPKGSEIRYLTRTSLAEYYYNKKKYKKAVELYDIVTKNLDDEWHTKNLYNYGWCLLKTHKFEKAITTLEHAYDLSSKDFYIDFRGQIMSGLVNFYVLGKQIERGKKFILSKVDDKYDALFSYLKKVSNKGYKEESIELIALTEKFIDPKQRDVQLADLRLFQFDFHKQFNEKFKMHEISQAISKLKLTDYQKEDITYKISEEVGTQQLLLKNEYNKEDGIYTASRLTTIISYFDLLSGFDTKNSSKYLYYSAETLYTVAEFKKALTYYKNAIEIQQKTASDLDLNEKAIDSIFSCIDLAKLSKVEKSTELEYAYTKHISIWPNTQKSFIIYPKLFSLYLFSERFDKSQATINAFHESFPKAITEQRTLFKQQIDYFIKKEKINLIADKINLMYKGYLNFSFKDTKKTEKILADILFNKYQGLSVAGKKDEAIAGYKAIFYKKKYPKSVRADAAFNMGIIYIDLLDSSRGVKWFKKSFPLFTDKETIQRREYLEKVSLRSSLLQDFLNAANIQKIVLQLFCHQDKSKNLDSYNKSIVYDLANDYVTKAMFTYNKYKSCIPKENKWIDEYILTHLFMMNHESDLEKFASSIEIKKQFKDKLGAYYENLYWKYYGKSKRKEILYSSKIADLKCESCYVFSKSRAGLENLEKSIKNHLSKKIRVGKTFNPEAFNNILTSRLTSIQPVLKEGDNLLALAHPEISIMAYDLLTSCVENFANEIAGIEVPVEDKDFQKQFRSQMIAVSSQVGAQSSNYKKQANKFVSKNNILTFTQNKTHSAYDVLQIGETRAPAGVKLSTLDLGEK